MAGGYIPVQENNFQNHKSFQDGKQMLKTPALPLVRMVFFFFFSGPFETIASVVDEFKDPLEMDNTIYENPDQVLAPHLPVLQQLEPVKRAKAFPEGFPIILDEELKPINKFKALEHWICQQVLTQELEKINSLLCEPCGCILCCCGPLSCKGEEEETRKCFFEIPLSSSEAGLFDGLARIDTEASRGTTANAEPSLSIDDAPFYKQDRSVISWRNGLSMILPRDTYCPQLESRTGRCRIYEKRPDVCRRPQIFPYLLEKHDSLAGQEDAETYLVRNKILAVWDCPYVRELKEEIARYILLCGLEPIFKENKI